jgi:hypothetical protein
VKTLTTQHKKINALIPIANSAPSPSRFPERKICTEDEMKYYQYLDKVYN